MNNNEMINNVAEEVVNNAVEEMADTTPEYIRTVETPKTVALTIAYSAAGIAFFEAAKWGIKKVWAFGEKTVGKIRDNKNAKKAAKAKVVEGTDCVVEDA